MRKQEWRVWLNDEFGPYSRRWYARDLESLVAGLPPHLRDYLCITNPSGQVVAGENIFE